jgi:hypothetical protein
MIDCVLSIGDMVRAKTKLTSRMIKADYRVRDYVKVSNTTARHAIHYDMQLVHS